ncbi:MAG: hypothetical protein A2Y07_06770 [Planctomycetes bacterium GWF2_50_10]|nr:MAG: hypothetical protein A2Y07_06770 [Planctomycetes bacterium GWF2_50_10]
MISEAFMTKYAPSQLSDEEAIQEQVKLVAGHYSLINPLYDAVSEIVLIVNQNRQIVFFNNHFPQLLGINNPDKLYGLRPGEALGCLYSCKSPGGCGTTQFCSQCGAVNAILAALSNKADLRECRLLQQVTNNAFDLLVRTTPLEIKGQLFSIVAITDISHEKRRRALERIFFHDVMNTAFSLNILSNMLDDNASNQEIAEFKKNMVSVSKQLMEEIKSQKEFLAAEFNEFQAQFSTISAIEILNELLQMFKQSSEDQHIELIFETVGHDVKFRTDRTLIKRVLGNMIKNALEASRRGQKVTISCRKANDRIEFRVHNQSFIPEDGQLQIFQRSFSTKGEGRGLGTYSMKLLSERYLKGNVGFESSEKNGTTFIAEYPIN